MNLQCTYTFIFLIQKILNVLKTSLNVQVTTVYQKPGSVTMTTTVKMVVMKRTVVPVSIDVREGKGHGV